MDTLRNQESTEMELQLQMELQTESKRMQIKQLNIPSLALMI